MVRDSKIILFIKKSLGFVVWDNRYWYRYIRTIDVALDMEEFFIIIFDMSTHTHTHNTNSHTQDNGQMDCQHKTSEKGIHKIRPTPQEKHKSTDPHDD